MATPTRPIPDPRGRLVSGGAPGRVGNLESIEFGGLARGINILGAAADQAAREAEENERLADQLRLAKASTSMRIELAKRLDALDPLSPTYEDDVQRAVDDVRNSVLETASFSRPETIERFGIEAMAAGEEARLDASKLRRRALWKQAEVDFKDHESRLLNAIAADPVNAEAIIAKNKAATDALLASLDPAKRAAFQQALQDGAIISVAEGLARQGKYDQAIEFIRSDAASGVDPDVLIGAERRVVELENRARQERLRNTAAAVEDLEYRLYTGAATEADLAAAAARGLYRDREGTLTQHRLILYRTQQERMKREEAAADKAGKLVAGVPDGYPKNQKEADALWEYVHAGKHANPEDELAAAIGFSTKTGFLPAAYRSRIEAAERANDPDYLAAMARLDDRIRTGNPAADTGAGDRLMVVQDLAKAYGGDYERAAKDVLDRGLSGKTVNQINTLANDAFKRTVPSWEDRVSADIGTTDPRAVAEYERRARRLFVVSGDANQALRLAAQSMRREGWAETRIGGGRAVQSFAPETLLPPFAAILAPDQRTRIIDDDVSKLLATAGITVPDVLPEWIPEGTPKYRLVVDREAEDRARSYGEIRPRLEVLNAYGVYEPVRLDNGDYVRWRPPNEAELKQHPIVADILKDATDTARRLHDQALSVASARRRALEGTQPAWRRNVAAERFRDLDPDGDRVVKLKKADADLGLIDELEEAGYRVEIED